MIRVDDKAGPTQGVQAKENRKPIKKAVFLVILLGLKLIFNFFSLFRKSTFNIPNWNSPKITIKMPPTSKNIFLLSLKNRPSPVKDSPKIKKDIDIPKIKNKV